MARLELVTLIRAPAQRCFDLSRDIDLHVRSMTHSGEPITLQNGKLQVPDRPIVPFIAETGGQNAMIVDSTALIEQVRPLPRHMDVLAALVGNARGVAA